MQTENDTTKPETELKQETGEGCSGSTCSLSSDTPETTQYICAVSNELQAAGDYPNDTVMYLRTVKLARKLEKERDQAREYEADNGYALNKICDIARQLRIQLADARKQAEIWRDDYVTVTRSVRGRCCLPWEISEAND